MPFEVLPGLPPYGPMAIVFTRNGAREHREGLVVRFYPRASEPWVGNFIGGETACNVVLDHPDENYVIVVAQGEVCFVDPENRAIIDRMAGDIEQVISIPSLGSVVFQCSTDFFAIKSGNAGWQSPRISWDGFRNIEVRGTELLGEAYSPVSDAWMPFRLDLLTGHCADGIYEKEMSRAVPVSRGGKAKSDPSLD
ncbi:hypothetical protein V1292_000232 [Bradyrhizobium sp. AZCC 1719]|uniref:hypothetical protein n=1 Tax=Bradyrhizobium sp. AZCC 1719 TaxID=3117028 RepID=UPI002FF04ACC